MKLRGTVGKLLAEARNSLILLHSISLNCWSMKDFPYNEEARFFESEREVGPYCCDRRNILIF